MRSRNIKPGFFKNEQLAELPAEARLLFVGLWCMADREGRLEDRPKRIKIELFPGDNFDVDRLLDRLSVGGLIERYEVDHTRYIQVLNFQKHQHPHYKEGQSSIPKPGVSTQSSTENPGFNHLSSIQEPDLGMCQPGASPGPARLIPDSLIPDSLIPDYSHSVRGTRDQKQDREAFERLKAAYPRGIHRDMAWQNAERSFYRLLEDGEAAPAILDLVFAYAAQQSALGNVGKQFVLSPAKFFSDGSWRGPFPLPEADQPARTWEPGDDDMEPDAAHA